MWYVVACRACLATEGKFEKFNAVSKRYFAALTGLEVHDGDGYPTHLCGECYMQIKKAVVFRRRSRRAHFVLKEIMNLKKQVTQRDIEIVDRKRTNLVSQYTYWQPEKSIAYSISTPDVEDADENTAVLNAETVNESTEINNYTGIAVNSKALSEIAETEAKDKIKMYNYKAKYLINQSAGKDVNYQIKIERDDSNDKNKIEKKSEVFNTKGELIKHNLKTVQSSSILVDIKPANYKEIDRLEEEERKRQRAKEIEEVMKEIHEDDFQNDDNYVDDFQPEEEIDLEDIFKGLKEIESESEGAMPEMELEEETKQNNSTKTVPRVKWCKGVKTRKTAHALAHCTIRLMTHNEQIYAFQQRMFEEPFKSSRFKCTICMIVFADCSTLMKHVNLHNKKVEFEHKCRICKNQFRSEKQLNRHLAEQHWYEYSCGNCNNKHYRLSDLRNCHEDCYQLAKKASRDLYENLWTKKLLHPALYASTIQYCNRYAARQRCPICKSGFFNIRNLKRHMVKHQPPKRKYYYQCDICQLYLCHRNAMENHMEHCHLYSYVCKVCGTCLVNRKQAIEHCSQHQLSGKIYTCDICNKVFTKESKLKYHTNTAHTQVCNMCGDTCNSLKQLYFHKLTTHGYITLSTEAEQNDPRYLCVHCNIYFAKEKAYFKHLANAEHEEVNNYTLGCVPCKKLFDNEDELARHKLDCQMNVYPKSCVYCDTTLSSKQVAVNHYSKMHPDLPCQYNMSLRHLCDVCGKAVYIKRLSRHLMNHNSVDADVKCKFCGATSPNLAHHVAHILFNHTHKPYCCTRCGVRYTNRCDCRDHILKTHAPVRPYKCEVCNRHFSHLDYLNEHCVKSHNVDLKKKDKSVFLTRKNIGTILVYPDMQIDGSLIDIDRLEKVQIESCDYMEQNRKVISYRDCFFFDPTVDPTVPTREINVKRKLSITSEDNIKTENKGKIKTESKGKKRKKIKKEDSEEDEKEKAKIETSFEYMDYVKNEDLPKLEDVVEDVYTKELPEETMELTEEPQIVEEIELQNGEETEDVLGELVEKDGEYYALVNGELYKIQEEM